ncbi:hypothetical protein ACI77O_12525 [Pseudomonas tritici]|uniref:hypothetical protein n=1 Tax=Pseudomonas tritici TaxID=2745518 RepID=UPI00387B0251
MPAIRHKPTDQVIAGKDVVLACDHDKVEAQLRYSDEQRERWMSIASQHETRAMALELELANLRNTSTALDSDQELEVRMQAAGMFSVVQLLTGAPMDVFIKHTGVNDLPSFLEWTKTRRGEFLKLQARLELADRQKDDLYEWVISHCAVFSEVMINLRAAMEGCKPQPRPGDPARPSDTRH